MIKTKIYRTVHTKDEEVELTPAERELNIIKNYVSRKDIRVHL